LDIWKLRIALTIVATGARDRIRFWKKGEDKEQMTFPRFSHREQP
jgi:hypothetical protein